MLKVKKILVTTFAIVFVFCCVTTANAYNAKFTYQLTSGAFSPWKYSSYVYKYTNDESPVVGCSYTSGCTKMFKYTVRNSDNDDRVVPISKKGTFSTTAFGKHTTVQNYKYRLGVKREDGDWKSSATSEGTWNIDSY